MSELNTPFHVNGSWNNEKGVEVAEIADTNNLWVFDCFEVDAGEIVKRINGYEQLQTTNKQLLSALDGVMTDVGKSLTQGRYDQVQEAITNAKQAIDK